MTDVENLLEEAYRRGGTALKALGIKLAKAYGEKGAMTDADVVRYIQDPAILERGKSLAAAAASGKLTEKVYNDLKRNIGFFKVAANKKLNNVQSQIAKEYAISRRGKEAGIDQKQAMKMLGWEVSKAKPKIIRQKETGKLFKLYPDGTREEMKGETK